MLGKNKRRKKIFCSSLPINFFFLLSFFFLSFFCSTNDSLFFNEGQPIGDDPGKEPIQLEPTIPRIPAPRQARGRRLKIRDGNEKVVQALFHGKLDLAARPPKRVVFQGRLDLYENDSPRLLLSHFEIAGPSKLAIFVEPHYGVPLRRELSRKPPVDDLLAEVPNLLQNLQVIPPFKSSKISNRIPGRAALGWGQVSLDRAS